MHVFSSHMNGVSHHEFSLWDPPFMWEKGARIYGIPRVHNNFPWIYDIYDLWWIFVIMDYN